jgi:hypothetical protein
VKLVHILVEGQTEEEFIRDIVNEYLQPKGIYLNVVLAKTKRAIGGNPAFRGGIVSYGKVEYDIKHLLRDTSALMVTTMIDYYRLPSDFPSFNDAEAKTGTAFQRVTYLEKKFAENVAHTKFLPYLSLHEFEALFFTKPEQIVKQVKGSDALAHSKLAKIRESYESPEEINLINPPSKRILELIPEYEKVAHGYLIAIEIGVAEIRKVCPHFNDWLEKIESL